MKRIFHPILFLIFQLTVLNISAQEISVGLKAGINISSLTEIPQAKSRTGLNAGAFINYSIVEHFGVSADILYSGEGAKSQSASAIQGGTVIFDNTLRLNYLRIPLLANIFFGELGNQLRPKISLGPAFGFLLGANIKSVITTLPQNTITETIIKDKTSFAGFDLGAIIGAGINYRISEKTWLNLDGRYLIGASDIYKIKLQGTDAVKNNSFSISAGIAFGLGS